MHSRRPPSLRHKGYRRESQNKNGSLHQHDRFDMEQQHNTSSAAPMTTSTTAARKKRTGIYTPQMFAVFLSLLILGLYARLMLLTRSALGGEKLPEESVRSGLRLSDKPAGMHTTDEKRPSDGGNGADGTTADMGNVTAAAEAQDKEWKEFVNGQTSKVE